jgi:hypothetical protein
MFPTRSRQQIAPMRRQPIAIPFGAQVLLSNLRAMRRIVVLFQNEPRLSDWFGGPYHRFFLVTEFRHMEVIL